MENEKLTKINNSVVKALQILEILAVTGGEMRLQDIAAQAQLPASTTLRMVNTLVCCGYLNQSSSTQKYYISYKLSSLSSYISGNNSLIKTAQPFMDTLGQLSKETVTLAIEDNGQALFLGIEDRYVQSVRVEHRIGSRSFLHISAVGKIFLLNYSLDQIKAIFEKSDKPALTQNTITEYSQLESYLHRMEQANYSINDEESAIGARCIARPIYDFTGRICAAIGISGPSVHLTDSYITSILPALIDTAHQISVQLGYNGSPERKLAYQN